MTKVPTPTPSAEPSLVRILADALLRADQHEAWFAEFKLEPCDQATIDGVLHGRLDGAGRRFGTFDRLYGLAPVTATEDARFRIDTERGKWAIVQGVVDRVDPLRPLVDLVAWHPSASDGMRLFTGAAVWLGPPPGFGRTVPYLVRNARAWLRAPDEHGATCVLSWSRDALDELRAFPRLDVADVDLRRLVLERFREALPAVELAA